jgi:hypothetical protein
MGSHLGQSVTAALQDAVAHVVRERADLLSSRQPIDRRATCHDPREVVNPIAVSQPVCVDSDRSPWLVRGRSQLAQALQ